MNLSEHFTLAELTRSALATRQGWLNEPCAEAVSNLRNVAQQILEPVRSHFGVAFSPNSGYRGLQLNRALGSSDQSQHVSGQAVDIELPGVSNHTLAEWIASHLRFDQLILEFYQPGEPTSGWVHVSVSAAEQQPRGEILTYTAGKWHRGLEK
jgi:uncharacterized protein YcbK (DUF882 family)